MYCMKFLPKLSGFYWVICCKNLELQHSLTLIFWFVAQDELFSKSKRQLKSKEGKTLERSNTDFLSLRRHVTNPGVNDSMVSIITLKCKTKPNGYFMTNKWPKQFLVTRGAILCWSAARITPSLAGPRFLEREQSAHFPMYWVSPIWAEQSLRKETVLSLRESRTFFSI